MDQTAIDAALARAGIVPILNIEEVNSGLRTIEALVSEGASVIEIVFRTPAAGPGLAAARRRFPGITLAAGTILDADRLHAAVDAGADCLIAPGLTAQLHTLAGQVRCPLIPGALTASEVMYARECGYRLLKIYPAEPSNAVPILKDYFNLFPDTRFLATGKITPAVLPAYAALPNLSAVGGSWMLAAGSLRADLKAFFGARSDAAGGREKAAR